MFIFFKSKKETSLSYPEGALCMARSSLQPTVRRGMWQLSKSACRLREVALERGFPSSNVSQFAIFCKSYF